jgi:uncharacterized protein DUF2491
MPASLCRRLGIGFLAAALVLAPAVVDARARSSGGYSRPSYHAPSFRTPSVMPRSAPAVPRTPSTSGGYSRPGTPPLGGFGASPRAPSAADREIGRGNASNTLRQYRAQQERERTPSPAPAPGGGYAAGRTPRYDAYGGRGYGGPNWWYANRGWTAPGWAYGGRPSFGIWNGLFLWFLLDTLSRPGHAAWFYDHQNDPGVQQWRQEAEQRASENPDVRAKLDALDRQVAERQGQPRNPDFMPPDTPREVAEAPASPSAGAAPGGPSPGGGWPGMLAVILVGGIVLFVLWRRRQPASTRPAAARTAGTGGGSMASPLETAGNILKRKLSGEKYKPERFRVGMTIPYDPTPFLLSAGTTRVPAPAGVGAGSLLNVSAVGTLRNGVTLTRLYLDDRRFFQIHLDENENPDECRYFGLVDEVSPASPDEWSFWLDEREGMIGWPQFQMKDGKVYDRAWAAGAERVPPRIFAEEIVTVNGTRSVKLHAMLYVASTGAAAPAPESEYILLAAVEAQNQAWVEIRAGLDVNPASLNLS